VRVRFPLHVLEVRRGRAIAVLSHDDKRIVAASSDASCTSGRTERRGEAKPLPVAGTDSVRSPSAGRQDNRKPPAGMASSSCATAVTGEPKQTLKDTRMA